MSSGIGHLGDHGHGAAAADASVDKAVPASFQDLTRSEATAGPFLEHAARKK